MKKEHTVRHTLSELPAGRIDRDRVWGMTPEETEAHARADTESPLPTDAELSAGQLVWPADRAKVPVCIRLDAEIVDHYRSGGPGYQTRINADLRDVVRRREKGVARDPRRRSVG